MDAQGRHNRIAGAFARERHAANLVVSVIIGVSHQAHLILRRQVGGAAGAHRCRSMTAVDDAILLRHVVGHGLILQTLVEWIIDGQCLFAACQWVVIVLQNIILGEVLCPESELIEITTEVSLTIEHRVVADRETIGLFVDLRNLYLGQFLAADDGIAFDDIAVHQADHCLMVGLAVDAVDLSPGAGFDDEMRIVVLFVQRYSQQILILIFVVMQVEAE